jgi:ankyrin repeat domain-containing protein 50
MSRFVQQNIAKRLPDITSWTYEHFESCTQYLNERPFANYALCYLKHHIDGCHRDANVLDIVSKFIDELTHNPAVFLLESWASSHLNKTLQSNKQGGAAKTFRNKIIHAAVRNGFLTAAEMLFVVGANVESKGNGDRTPLSWAAGNGHEAVVELLVEKGDEKSPNPPP